MRLGGRIFAPGDSPAAWVAAVQAKGYRAAYCPVPVGTDGATVAAYARAAADAGIVIAEVGVWNNPLAPDPAVRQAAIAKCQASLALADAMGARCCVNIAGSRGEKWDGPHPDDLTEATFDLIVATTQAILDAVRPDRTFYTLEAMPWAPPDSVESYVRLVQAIDRPGFAVHFDPVNLVNCPARYFRNGDLIQHFIAALGPRIRSVHVKDTRLHPALTVHLDEVRPGLGELRIDLLLRELARLDPDLPVMLEHLEHEAEYDAAAAHLRAVAAAEGVTL